MDIRDLKLNDLTDDEVEVLNSIVYEESQRRIEHKVRRGDFPEPTGWEKMAWMRSRLEAVREYRSRCEAEGCLLSLSVAHTVFRILG